MWNEGYPVKIQVHSKNSVKRNHIEIANLSVRIKNQSISKIKMTQIAQPGWDYSYGSLIKTISLLFMVAMATYQAWIDQNKRYVCCPKRGGAQFFTIIQGECDNLLPLTLVCLLILVCAIIKSQYSSLADELAIKKLKILTRYPIWGVLMGWGAGFTKSPKQLK